MKKVIITLVILLVVGLAGYLLLWRQPSSIPVNAFLPVLQKQIEALNSQDVDAYLETIHEESPVFEDTRNILLDQFAHRQQEYKLISWELLDFTRDELQVVVVQTVRDLQATDGADLKAMVTHTMKKSDDHWKVYSSVINQTEYLD